MNIGEIEQMFIERLKAGFKDGGIDIAVDAYPNSPRDYKLTHANGIVLVRYDAGAGGDIEGLQQVESIEFEIVILSRNLRTPKIGIYDIITAVKKYITSWPLDGCTQFAHLSTDFLAEKSGRWDYGMKFRTYTVYMLGT